MSPIYGEFTFALAPSGGLLGAIDATAVARDQAAAALRWAGLLFLVGLVSVGTALAIFIVEVTV